MLIFKYTRAQAIEDGVLVDVSDHAQELGIKFPVTMTAAAHAKYVEVPEGAICQDPVGRLHDVLWMLLVAIKASSSGASAIRFTVHVRNDNKKPRPASLRALCHGGDQGEPVITISLPDED